MAADGGGGIVAPDLFPMFIDERGSRRNRIWELIQSPLGADADACGPMHDCTRRGVRWQVGIGICRRKSGIRRFHFPKRCLTGIGVGVEVVILPL